MTTATEKPSETPTPALFVYCGRRMLTSGKFGVEIHVLSADGKQLGRSMIFPAGKRRQAIGGVYSGASFTETKAAGLDRASYVRQWPDETDVVGWEVKDEETAVEIKAVKLEADAMKVGSIDRQLRGLRAMYADLSRRGDRAGAAALELAVVRSLRRAPK